MASIDQSYRSSRVDPRYVVNWVDGWDELGEKTDPRPWEWEQVKKLGLDDVTGFVGGVAKGSLVITVLGDRDRLDLAAIGKIAPVEELKIEQLFSYGPFPAALTPPPAPAANPAP